MYTLRSHRALENITKWLNSPSGLKCNVFLSDPDTHSLSLSYKSIFIHAVNVELLGVAGLTVSLFKADVAIQTLHQ